MVTEGKNLWVASNMGLVVRHNISNPGSIVGIRFGLLDTAFGDWSFEGMGGKGLV